MASTSAAAAARVLSGYRRLLRSQQKLFVGDFYAQNQAQIAIRSNFEENRKVTDAAKIEELLVAIDEADDMLRNGFAQGQLNEDKGSYEVKIRADQTTKEDTADGGDANMEIKKTADISGNDTTKTCPEVVVTSYKSR
mmetsp:Transcript_38366/g.56517  ORF Transcript_38366/g.56517 Transcript_38366/m.56517 type:complete len:138 (+) Transcript_38366:44-457(+)|eukprot:CAMPEP_0195518384 /NCGR_PEP_ID=MMETSP0794_2-20130614/12774_1 /TAXON_ID=515487 /ORGANISM="Stephanopyxis turris, Strain CCMP 815" /LENGTH=137 /DNA_ID=CAMNT_0040647335 /DNA_START=42 /DNA_END=455 /DNA_ORIENTATION=+